LKSHRPSAEGSRGRPAAIFISYRRSDAAGHAGRLFDRLKLWFDVDDLFYDVESVESGDVFPRRVEHALTNAKVVLILIGPDWISEMNRRAEFAGVDFVRVEVQMALRLQAATGGPKVVPVLMGITKPPAMADLHESLRSDLIHLFDLEAHWFQGKNLDWEHQFDRLRTLIASVPGVRPPRYRPPMDIPRPFRLIDHVLSLHFRDPQGVISSVREALLANGAVALCGMGGVGKTQIALKYSLEFRENYAGVWWLRAEANSTLQLDAHDACIAAGVPLKEQEVPSAALKAWLILQKVPWLLVFDNAETAFALSPHLPQPGLHHMLITSRVPAWSGVARVIELNPWPEHEGANFLADRLGTSREVDLTRLACALGSLPLALEQSAAFLEQTAGDVADYSKNVESIKTAPFLLDQGRASTGYERSVVATLSIAFPQLGDAARQLLGICSFFSAYPIPECYFRNNPELLPATLAAATGDPVAWERMIGELRHGILQRVDLSSDEQSRDKSDEGPGKALVVHRLNLEIARHVLGEASDSGPRALAILKKQCLGEVADPTEWQRFAVLSPHVLNFGKTCSHSCFDGRAYSWMLDRVAAYLRDGRALYRESEDVFRRAIELSRAILGDEHPDTLTSINNLGETLRAQGNLQQARIIQENNLSTRMRVCGEEHPDTLESMINLAHTLFLQDDLEGARALEERVLAVRRRSLELNTRGQ
jgi:hypothetical protein